MKKKKKTSILWEIRSKSAVHVSTTALDANSSAMSLYLSILLGIKDQNSQIKRGERYLHIYKCCHLNAE